MKNNNFIKLIGIVWVALLFGACEPTQISKPALSGSIDSSQLSFTVTPGSDDFHIVIKNTSSVAGITHWDLGNGTKADGESVTANYKVAKTYTITLFVSSNAGTASISKDYEQTKTDYSIFTDPVYINLSGGVDAVDGKTWVVDSLEPGHFGIGPADGNWPEWWAANPLQKTNTGAYDDEFVFKIDQFAAIYNNHGNNYAKDYNKDKSYYSNPIEVDGTDVLVNYTPQPGTWAVSTKEDGFSYLKLTAPTPLFFGFDYGAVDNEFRIDSVGENILKLSCIGGDGNRWYNILIPKGYVKPTVSYDLDVTATANENEYAVSLKNMSVPSGASIDSIVYDLGNGTMQSTTDASATFNVTYMRAGTYVVESTVYSSIGTFEKSSSVVVANNSSAYTPYLLNAMVMYNDFGETKLVDMAFDGNGTVSTISNPDNSRYPNRSANVALYTKDHDQWGNAFLKLPVGYRFDLTKQTTFRTLVYGKAGDEVLLKLENTDRGGNAWQTGAELRYTIKKDNTWEIASFDFAGVGAGYDWTGDIYTSDITTDSNFNSGFYNVIRIMYRPGDDSDNFSFYFDDLAGPHVEGLK